jgi:transposase-like protein
MNRTITFNELRKIKDSLPTGSMHRIADELGLRYSSQFFWRIQF